MHATLRCVDREHIIATSLNPNMDVMIYRPGQKAPYRVNSEWFSPFIGILACQVLSLGIYIDDIDWSPDILYRGIIALHNTWYFDKESHRINWLHLFRVLLAFSTTLMPAFPHTNAERAMVDANYQPLAQQSLRYYAAPATKTLTPDWYYPPLIKATSKVLCSSPWLVANTLIVIDGAIIYRVHFPSSHWDAIDSLESATLLTLRHQSACWIGISLFRSSFHDIYYIFPQLPHYYIPHFTYIIININIYI